MKLDFEDIYETLAINRNNIGHFPLRSQHLCVVDSSTKCLVARQHCKGKLFLIFVSTLTVGIVDSDITNSTNRTNCYVSIVTVVT
jgi:hypothetical protein